MSIRAPAQGDREGDSPLIALDDILNGLLVEVFQLQLCRSSLSSVSVLYFLEQDARWGQGACGYECP